jgi:transglutaminase-like putative cysteine protease
MHFSIRYLTEYVYDAPVSDNLNALRVRPATTSTQRCDEFTVRIDPEARVGRHSDYFGTEVLEFGIVKPHSRLTIDVRARVVTADPPDPPDADWDEVETDAYAEAAGEYLLPALDEPENGVLDDLVADLRRDSPLETVRLLCDLIPDRFEYRKGATYVGTTVTEFLQAGAGVCQDYVHLGLILLRRNGIAARYVSGYLWATSADDGDDSVEVDTHAWLEALLPGVDGRGEPVWVAADPTNRRLASETHVKIGHGRNYADVPPVKGVYQGTARAELESGVQMTRLDPQASARA